MNSRQAPLWLPALAVFGKQAGHLHAGHSVSLEMMALKRLPSETFGIMVSLEPAVASLLAMLLLDEVLSVSQWSAIGFIVVASIGSTITAKRSVASSPEVVG